MIIPASYDIDFTSLDTILGERSISRLLVKFQQSPVISQVLLALVSEIQAVSVAVADVIKYRTIAAGNGVNLDILGKIVGQERIKWQTTVSTLDTEAGNNVVTETDSNTIDLDVVRPTTLVSDADYRFLLLLRTIKNCNGISSVPEFTSKIFQITGVVVTVSRTGPMEIEVSVPTGSDVDLTRYLGYQTEDGYFMSYPATIGVTVKEFSILVDDVSMDHLIDETSGKTITG